MLAPLGEKVLVRLADAAGLMRLAPEEDLFSPGSRLEELSFLVTGQVGLHAPKTGLREAGVDVVARPCWLGLSAAILDAPSPLGARTLTAARLIAFPADEVRTVLRDVPSAAAAFLQEAAREMQLQTAEICRLKLRSTAQRLAAYLVDTAPSTEDGPARFVLPIGAQALAARIACSPSNLSRTFRELESFGVKVRSRAVVIEDVAGLRAYAGVLTDDAMQSCA